ncbi:MAG: hypothetical protein E6I87_01735 [Chloroflexi bacterium]|nr:MAG: hypothetical protein E6I87_01735 [Chloroflexota bacterium]
MDERARGASPPRGFRDILPTEARELRAIEATLTSTFESYGFVPLEPPAVEHATRPAIFGEGRTVQFLDRDGRLVELRPDVTTAVARLVAQRYRDVTEALRLSYFSTVYREEPAMTAGEREFVQAGAELIGPSGPMADAEVLALCVDAIERCGLSLDAQAVHVGNVALVRRLFADLSADARELVLGALRGGDQVGAIRIARDAGMSAPAIERARHILSLIGKAIDEIGEDDDVMAIRHVVHYARELYPGKPLWGVPNLSLVPELPYYTGVVFEIVHPALGSPIASGGRYDLLLAAFGAPRPATGFAINVARLHQALFAEGWRPANASPLVTLRPNGDDRVSLRCAAALRGAGLAVAIGAVAEPAGQPIVIADVVDERSVRLADGRVMTVDKFARELLT